MSENISDQELSELLAMCEKSTALAECPSCKVHPHRQACSAGCRDARKLAALPRLVRALQEERTKVRELIGSDAATMMQMVCDQRDTAREEVESLCGQLAEKEAQIESLLSEKDERLRAESRSVV